MADRRIDLVFGVDKQPTTANISTEINDIAAQISRNPPKIAFQLDTKATVGNINKQLEGLIKGLKPDKLVNNNKTLGSIIGSNSSKVAKSTEAQSNAIIQQKTAIDKKISALEGEKKATDRLRQARDSLNKMYETWNKNKTKENETEVLKQARTVEKMMAEIDKSPLKKYGELDSSVNKTIESLRNEGLATQELESKFKELQAAKENFDSSPTEANYSKVIAQLTEVKTLMDGIKSQKVDTNIVSNDTKKDVKNDIAEAERKYKSLKEKSFSSKKSTEEFVGLKEEYEQLIKLKEKFNSQPTKDNYGKLIAQLETVKSKMKEISDRELRLKELFKEEKRLEAESRDMNRISADNKGGTSDASVNADERRVEIYKKLRDIKAEIAELGAEETSNTANIIKQEQAMEKIAEKQARDNERSISKAHVLSNSHNTAIMSMQNYYERWGANISKNTALQEEFNMVMGKLKANGYSSVAEVNDAMSTFKLHVKQAGGEVETLSSKIQSLMSTRLGYMLAGFVSMAAINSIRQIYQNVVQVDTAMTELKKVTDETDATYSRFLSNASNRAVKLGSTMADTVNATADFARLGYSIDAASDMADAALVYKNVGDGITDISTASESLISTIKAFPEYENNAIAVIDKFNEVGNNFAISSSGIGEALQRSAGALAAANNTIDESIALAVGMNNITQDPAKVGTTLKTASLYLRAAKTEAEEAGESTEGMASSVSKLREELMTLTNNKVDIMLDENTFKSTYQIFKELSAIWKDLADVDQANILELIGGKRNASTLSSLLTTFDDVEEALQTSKGSAGSAMKENEKVLDSVEGRMTKIKAIYESISTNVLKSGLVKAVMTVVELLGKGANQLAKIGALVPAIIGGTAIKKMFSQVSQAKALFESLTAMRSASGKLDQYDLAVQLQGLSKFQQKSVLGMVGQNWKDGTGLASNTAAILNNVGAFQTRAEMMAKNISLNEQYKNYIDATTLAEMKQGAARALADGKDANEAAEIAAKIAATKAYTEAINEQTIAEISLEAAEKLENSTDDTEIETTLREAMASRNINKAMQDEIITRMQLNKLKEEGILLDQEAIKQRFSAAVDDIKDNPTNQYVPGVDKDGEKLGKSAMGGFSKLMLGLTIATTVISILVPVIRKLVTTTDEAASKLAEAKNEIKSNESQIESLQNNLDENKNKIKEIQSLGKLSITDQNDLNNLMSENQELSTQIALLKQRNAEQQKIVDKNSEKIWKNFNSNNFADFWNSSYTDNGKAKWWEKLIAFFGGDSGQILMSGSEYVEQSIGKLEELKKQYNSLFDSNGEVKDGQADVASDLKEQIQSVTSGLREALSELENVNNEEAQALYNKVLFAMSDLETQQELVSNMLDSFDNNLSTKIYDRVGKDNEYTVGTVQSILGITDKEYEALNKLTGSADATVDVLNSYVQKKNAEWDNIYKYFGGRDNYEAYVEIAENRKKVAQEITALAGKNDEKANKIYAEYVKKTEEVASRINNPMPKDPLDTFVNTTIEQNPKYKGIKSTHAVGNVNLNEAIPYIPDIKDVNVKGIKAGINDIVKEFKKTGDDLNIDISGDSAKDAIASYKDKIFDYLDETLGDAAPEFKQRLTDAWSDIDTGVQDAWTNNKISWKDAVKAGIEGIYNAIAETDNIMPSYSPIKNEVSVAGNSFNEILTQYKTALHTQLDDVFSKQTDLSGYLDKYSKSLNIETSLNDAINKSLESYSGDFDTAPNSTLSNVKGNIENFGTELLNIVSSEFGDIDQETRDIITNKWSDIANSISNPNNLVESVIQVNPSYYAKYLQQYRDVLVNTLKEQYSVGDLDLPNSVMFTPTTAANYSIGEESIPIATKIVFTDGDTGEAKILSADTLASYVKGVIERAKNEQDVQKQKNLKNITPIEDLIMGFDKEGIKTGEGFVSNIIAGIGNSKDGIVGILNDINTEAGSAYNDMVTQFSDNYADIAKYISTLDSEELSIASELFVDTNFAETTIGEFKNKVEGEMSLKLLADFDITKVGEQYEKMITAISQSGSGSGLTNETINSLKSNYGNLSDYDAGQLFERTAAGIQVNHEELKRLNQEYREYTVSNFENGIERLRQKYDEQKAALDGLTPGTVEYANAVAKLKDTVGQLSSMEFDFSQFQGLTSDLNNWLQVEQGGDIGDTFQSIVKSYEDMEKLYKEGKVGSEKLKSYLDLFTFQEGSVRTSEDVMNAWSGLSKEIKVGGKGIGFSQKDFLRDDIQGVKNFADAMVKLDYASKDNGVYKFENIDTYKLADSLGLSESLVKSMLDNMRLFGTEIGGVEDNSDSLHKSLEANKLSVESSVSRLKKNTKIKETGLLNGFNFNSANSEDLDSQIKQAKELIGKLTSTDPHIKIKCDDEELEDARAILVTLEQQKAKLEEPWYMKVSFNSNSSNPAEQAMSLVKDIQDLMTQREITLEVDPKADVSSLNKQISEKVKELDGTQADVKATLGFDDKQIQAALKKVGNVKAGADIDKASLNTIKSKIESIKPEIAVTAGISEDKVSPYLSSSEDGTKEVTLTVGPNNGVHNYIVNEDNDKKVNLNIGTNEIDNYLAQDLSKTINITQNVTKVVTRIEKDGEVDGTAHAYGSAYATGSAFAQGNWGIPYGGVSLGGELGQELLVRNGKFMTIGDSSAEFFQHKPGDIIFNAAQTQQIFKYGKIRSGKKRGKAYATGTAFASGSSASSNTTYTGGWNLAAIQKNTGVKTTNSTTTAAKQTATAAKQTASAAKSTKESSEKAKEAIEKFNEYAKEFFDWSEKKLEKLEDKTEKLVNRAEKNVDNGNYNRATSQYKKALDSINESIKANNAMMPQYQSVADKILEKAVSTGAIKSADAAEIKSKVKDGTLDVAKYSDDVQTVIKEYQTWIDKVEDSQKNIEDLIDKYEEYSNAMYEIPLTKASDKVDRLSDSLSILEKKLDLVTNASSKARIINKEINNVRSQNTAIRTAYETANSNYVSARRKINESSDAAFKGLSSKDITKIIGNVQKGKYIDYSAYNNLSTSGVKAIINYNNALKSQEEAFKNLRDSSIETKISINEYAETLANLPLDKASKKLEALADSISYLDDRISNAKTPKAKESALSKKQEKVNKVYNVTQNEVDETTTNQAKRATKLVNTLVGNLSEGSYKLGKDGKFAETKNASKSDKSIIELINNVISGKKVSRVGMDANSTEYTQATKYNKSVDARNESLKAVPKAEQQWISDTREISEALAGLILDTTQKNIDKVDDKITENNKRIDVASSAQRKNELLRENDKYTRQQDDAWKRAEKDSRKYINETWGDKSLKKAFKNNQEFAKANEGKSKGEKLSAKGLEIGSEAYEAVIKYNDAIDANTKIVKESTNAQLDNKKSRQENANERYNNRKEEAQRELDKAEKSYDRAQEKTESLDRNYGKKYEAALENEKKESENVAKAKQEYADSLREAYKQNKDDMSKADKIAAKDEIAKADKEAREATKESAKIDEEIVDARIKKLQEYGGTDSNGNKIAGMRELESEAKNLNKVISDDKHKTTATDYQNLINNAEGQKDNLRAQNEELEKAQSTLDKRSEAWQKLQDEIDKNNESIVSLTEEQEKYNDEILNLPIQELEHENDALSETIDKQQDLIELKKDTGKVVNAEDYQVMIDASKEQVTNLLEENKLLEEQKGLVEEGSDAYYKVQKQIDDNNDAIREAEKSQRQWNDAVRELDYKKAQRELNELQNEAEKIQDSISLSKAYGGTGSPLDYIRLILNSKQQVAQYNAIKAAKVAERSNYEVGSEKYDELTQEIYDADDAIRNAKIDQAQWNTEMQNIPVGIFSDVTGLMSSVAQYIKSFAKLRKAIMRTSSEMDYIVEIGANLATIGIDAASIGFDAVAAGLSLVPESLDNLKSIGQFAGKSTLEWVQGGVDAAREINELLAENANLLVEYRDNILWKSLDAAHTKTQQLMTVFGKITDLINDDMLYDKDGGLTNFGIAKMSELTKQYQLADAEVNNYKDDINKLNKLYALGWYTTEEFNEKLTELQSGLLDSSKDSQEFKRALLDMIKETSQAELDNLNELIEARQNALNAKKDYYEYDKSIRGKTKDIQALEAQLKALENVEDAESKAKAAKLKADLADAQEELNDTINEHMLDISQDALDELRNALQDAFDDNWTELYTNLDKMEETLRSVRDSLDSTENQKIIDETQRELLKNAGIVFRPEDGIDNTQIERLVLQLVDKEINTNSLSAEDRFNKAVQDLQNLGMKNLLKGKNLYDENNNKVDLTKNDSVQGIKEIDSSKLHGYTLYSNEYNAILEYNEALRSLQHKVADSSKNKTADERLYDTVQSIANGTFLTDLVGKTTDSVTKLVTKEGNVENYYADVAAMKANGQTSVTLLDRIANTLDSWSKKMSKGVIGNFFGNIFGSMSDGFTSARDSVANKSVVSDTTKAIKNWWNGVTSTVKGWFTKKDKTASYATGTKYIKKDQWAWTQEHNKEEIIVRKSDNAILTPLSKGDSVLPSYLTENLYRLAQGSLPVNNIKLPDISLPDCNYSMEINQNYDCLIKVEGSVDAAVIDDLKSFTNDLLEKSYDYTQKKMFKGYMQSGGKRKI